MVISAAQIWDTRTPTPVFHGTVIMQMGRATLSGGSASIQFAQPYTRVDSYVIMAIDATATNPVSVAWKTPTAVALSGTGTDVVDWLAVGYSTGSAFVPVEQVSIDANYRLIVNGKPFLMTGENLMDYNGWFAGGYTLAEAEAKIVQAGAAGINTTTMRPGITPYGLTNYYQQENQRYGLYAEIYCDTDPVINLSDPPALIQPRVQLYRDLPFLVRWGVKGEFYPFNGPGTPEFYIDQYNAFAQYLRSQDPKHPITSTEPISGCLGNWAIIDPASPTKEQIGKDIFRRWISAVGCNMPQPEQGIFNSYSVNLKQAWDWLGTMNNEMLQNPGKGGWVSSIVTSLCDHLLTASGPLNQPPGTGLATTPPFAAIYRHFMAQVAWNARAFLPAWNPNIRGDFFHGPFILTGNMAATRLSLSSNKAGGDTRVVTVQGTSGGIGTTELVTLTGAVPVLTINAFTQVSLISVQNGDPAVTITVTKVSDGVPLTTFSFDTNIPRGTGPFDSGVMGTATRLSLSSNKAGGDTRVVTVQGTSGGIDGTTDAVTLNGSISVFTQHAFTRIRMVAARDGDPVATIIVSRESDGVLLTTLTGGDLSGHGPLQTATGDQGLPFGWLGVWDNWRTVQTDITTLTPVILDPAFFMPIPSSNYPYKNPNLGLGGNFQGIYAAKKIVAGITWIIALNVNMDSAGPPNELACPGAIITGAGPAISSVVCPFENNRVPTFGYDTIIDDFAPMQTHVYKVTAA